MKLPFLPCPKCGGLVNHGDKPAMSRIRCRSCGHRPTLYHTSNDPECWPECDNRKHWRLGAVK